MKVIVFGATSAIAEATCRCMAQKGWGLYLIGRAKEKLQNIASDLQIRGASAVHHHVMDLRELDHVEDILNKAKSELGGLDCVYIAHGVLTDERRAKEDLNYFKEQVHINFVSQAWITNIARRTFQAQGFGTIAVISSVAGERGRSSNYVYGATKAAVTAFTSGARAESHKLGINILTIKPGIVDTPMTAHLPKSKLMAPVEKVGEGIFQAIQGKQRVFYVPKFWRLIMNVIKCLPEAVFMRTKF